VGETLETIHTIQALNMALESLPIDGERNLVHHSGRGIQYASYLYVNKLKDFGIKISMTETSDPKDNAIAERVNCSKIHF
jgi:transposase InsO family protein